MKILFLIGTYPNYGGVESVTTTLANLFAKQGDTVCIASFRQPFPELANEQLDKNIRLLYLKNYTLSFGNIKRLKKCINDLEIDVIINQWCLPFVTTFLCKLCGRKKNVKVVDVYHNNPAFNNVIGKFQNRKGAHNYALLKLARFFTKLNIHISYCLCDRYVLLSESFVPILQKVGSIKNARKIAVIPNPITILTDYNKADFSKKQKTLLYVGRIEHTQKKIYRLLDIWQLLQDVHPDWDFKVVGDGPDLLALKQKSLEMQLKRIEFCGFQEPLEYYKEASLLVLTSDYEGFGLVIVEGMCWGCVPIVWGSYPAVFDIIKGKSGSIVKAEKEFQPELMASEICSYIENEDKLSKARDAAIVESKRFSCNVIVDSWNTLFRSLVE